jgi:hypothetical protein
MLKTILANRSIKFYRTECQVVKHGAGKNIWKERTSSRSFAARSLKSFLSRKTEGIDP